ncbi:mediator of RNA polymerase II transcription subunit 26-like isoform X2 [Chironomus tepperi]|uniref:mediator of RNA polymerase II transcription subunit 26-like isoform X2 n=1 Tax=Chironomus tepperi TaxID=113505 RepID=UPI00391EEEB6
MMMSFVRDRIRNKSAVVKVVTCLEAFNITHESYREVQNTRIIKDLQALRQNKANDQVLAKRIKNLLRKWKERLAASIPSQPNSPQNISQGSSDTQFMTQQSQSPPNSQPPRIVNGPTSFKNLLPKSQNHHQAVTSPVPQKISHIHQNGGIFIESSQSQSQSLLGKRKVPSSNNIDVSSDIIDENSNHNRKNKMMKKSDFGATSSPLMLNANNNSNSSSMHHNHHPHNNNNNSNQLNQLINNKLHSNVPVPQKPPLPPQQQQKQQITQQQNIVQQPPQIQQSPAPPKIEEPKKRGRRKGSKGFDSTLNGNIPDFQAEIQQKIALSAGKRNKTTFELQQMLESHQNSSMSWTNGDVHDSNSLDRVNNFTTASYNPPEPAYSNFELPKVKKEVTEIKREPISENSQLTKPTTQELAATSLLRPLTIEDEIAKLYSKLPPIDFDEALRSKFEELNSYDDNGDLVECTCTFREVITYEDDEQTKPKPTNGFDESIKVNINGDMNNKKPDESDLSEDDDETDDFCAVEDIERSPSPPPRHSAVKSIFDPEYDANENLIEEMVRSRKPRDNLPKIIEVKIEKDAVKSSRIESMINSAVPEPSIQQMERVPIITYVCDEDPMCPASSHFRRDPVTQHDIQELHNSFKDGINGYFNGIMEERQEQDYSKDNENIDYAKHCLWKRVVPRYNFLTLDKIPKTFDDDSPFSIPPPPHETSSDVVSKNGNNDDDTSVKDEKKSVSLNDTIKVELESVDKFSMHKHRDIEFREWHEVMNVRSYNDEILTILPYVVID